MNADGVPVLILGALLLGVAGIGAPKAPNVSYLVGTYLPGLACVLVGLKLGETKKSKGVSGADVDKSEAGASKVEPASRSVRAVNSRAGALKFSAHLGIGGGILLMSFGGAVAQSTQEWVLLVASLLSFTGCAWEIWGCVNYMRWKGRSGWFGLLGYFLVPGLMILVCFPNRRKKLLEGHRPEQIAAREALSLEDESSGYRFLLTLVPLGVLFMSLGSFLVWSRSSIDVVEWKQVAPPGIGFQALMPGTPRLEQNSQQTPAGTIELRKFTVVPKGTNELFMIVSVRFPESVARELGGTEKLLELGRQDVLSASQGQVKSERRTTVSGCPGLEMEVLPPKGAIIKARICATKNQVYEVTVHVPKVRLTSDDVLKFLDSFKLSAELDAAADRRGE